MLKKLIASKTVILSLWPESMSCHSLLLMFAYRAPKPNTVVMFQWQYCVHQYQYAVRLLRLGTKIVRKAVSIACGGPCAQIPACTTAMRVPNEIAVERITHQKDSGTLLVENLVIIS